jgi:hypothetical protein
MNRRNSKIISFSSYILLFCYLLLIGMGVFHFHKLDLHNQDYKFSEESNSKSHLIFNGVDFLCPIFTAFSSISISINEFDNPFIILPANYEFTLLTQPDRFYKNSHNYYYSLRAPPKISI